MKKESTEKQLIEFGYYLLSMERKNRYRELSSINLSGRLSVVNDADVRNFVDRIIEQKG